MTRRKFLCGALFLLGFGLSSALIHGPGNEAFAEKAPVPFLQIEQLNSAQTAAGEYETEGYVINIIVCDLCPPEGDCSPCPSARVHVSAVNKREGDDKTCEIDKSREQVGMQDMLLNIPSAGILQFQRKFRFRVRIGDERVGEGKGKRGELLDYVPLEEAPVSIPSQPAQPQ